MTTLHMLTVRTNAALGRLATLQRRAEKVDAPGGAIIRPALKELSEALEELQVANDQLQQQVEELSEIKEHGYKWQSRFQELLEVMPTPCVWTNAAGAIDDANPAAAALLNVSATHLNGRPLMLFLTDRERFADALSALTGGSCVIEVSMVLRPRERRARNIRLIGRRFQSSERYCWFLQEATTDPAAGTL